MSGPNFYFHYQVAGKESKWEMAFAQQREEIISTVRPAFSTILDLSGIPADNDWTTVRYRGPFHADFDAEDDLELVCAEFKNFLGKLDVELDFDITQARLFATGSKGFHIEIPAECFMPKVPATGTTWLAYIYRAMAESLIVDTLDTNIYTGKKGRQWRTPNVQRENGCYKVPLTVDEALSMTPELYAELIKEPREVPPVTPASCNSKFAMLYDRSKEKVVTQMRGKKKRQAKANEVLDPWRKANKTPPTIEALMAGDNIAEGAGFQSIAMQLAIYAVNVEMPVAEFLDRCKGLCEKHVSDSRRYGTYARRREELARMHEYFSEDSLYDFDVGPIVRLVKAGTPVTDLGVMDTEDRDDTPTTPASGAAAETDVEDGDKPTQPEVVNVDVHKSVRRGFFMNAEGMFTKRGDIVESLCRATLRRVESFYDVEKKDFKGFEFDIVVKGRTVGRTLLGAEAFTSAASMRKFFVAHQISFQGGDPETTALLDIMSEKAARGGHVYVYPREGFFVLNNPEVDSPEPVKVYLTQDTYLASTKEGDQDHFTLRYRPTQATSSYNIDIHKAPKLDDSMIPALHDIFNISKPDVVSKLLGWFTAAHYRSAYLYLFHQFPLLQVYGEAGSGKTQSVMLLAHLHWYIAERISVKSATSCTPFAMDAHASSSTSAPFIIDEYKPRELRQHKGKYEKLKDVLKACYVGADIGERGTINKGAESHLAIVKSKATAPIVFMGEAVEMETAIIERSVCVNLSQSFQTRERQAAFQRLQQDPTPLSALGRAIVEMGFKINMKAMREEVRAIQAEIEAKLPDFNDTVSRRAAPRVIFNQAIITHSLRTLKRILAHHFGTEFDADFDRLAEGAMDVSSSDENRAAQVHGMSEVSKVLSRIALLSREKEAPWKMEENIDYVVGDGWVEIKLERAYDSYRRYCASIHDQPLFDNLDAFVYALQSYTPCIDRVCADSELREDGSSERVVRMSIAKLKREGVQSFRTK